MPRQPDRGLFALAILDPSLLLALFGLVGVGRVPAAVINPDLVIMDYRRARDDSRTIPRARLTPLEIKFARGDALPLYSVTAEHEFCVGCVVHIWRALQYPKQRQIEISAFKRSQTLEILIQLHW